MLLRNPGFLSSPGEFKPKQRPIRTMGGIAWQTRFPGMQHSLKWTREDSYKNFLKVNHLKKKTK